LRKAHEEGKQQQLPPTVVAIKKQEEQRVVEKTATITTARIEDDIQTLRRSVSQALDALLNQLTRETETLNDIRTAIAIERTQLTDMKNITLADDALQLLLSEYDAKEKELKEKQTTAEMQWQESIAHKKTAWEREQEEYAYQLKIDRKKEEDAYEQTQANKRRLFEEDMKQKLADLGLREDMVQKQEAELVALREQRDVFPRQLQDAVDTAERVLRDQLTKEFDVEKRLLTQEWKSDKGLLDVKIVNLEELIKNQHVEIMSLKASLATANNQAQTLASTVVEHMSGAKFLKQADGVKDKGVGEWE